MATEDQINAAKAELKRRRVEAAKAELARRNEATGVPDRSLPVIDRINNMQEANTTFNKGVIEPVVTMGSSMAGDAIGGIAGIGQIPLHALGISDTTPEQVVKGWQDRFSYTPKTEQAKQVLNTYGETLDPLVKAIDKTRTGDKTFEAGGGPMLSTINEIAPDLVGAMLGIKGLKTPVQHNSSAPGTLSSTPLPFSVSGKTGQIVSKAGPKDLIKQDIFSQTPTARAAKFDVTPAGLKINDLAKRAIGQGWDESFVSWVKTANKQTRENLRDMVNITKRRVGDAKDFTYNGRPSDVLGKSLKKRIDRLKQVQRQSGRLVDNVAKQQLKGKNVDLSQATNRFKEKIAQLGGVVDEQGKLQFGIDSKLYAQASKQKALQDVFDKVSDLGDMADGYAAHDLKQFITEYVDFGKAGKEGISRNIQNLLKELRVNINETLKGQSKAYDKVNTAYSETTRGLGDFQSAAGKSIDLFGPEADAATGRVLRKLLSNMQNRENLAAAMEQMESIASKYGGNYSDDLMAQAKAVNEIERLLGSFAESSFKGEIASAGQRLVENPSIRQAGTEAARMSARQIQKMTQNDTKKIQALEQLIYQGNR